MLRTQYRQPINWTIAGLREAQKSLDHWYDLTADVEPGYLCADALGALLDDLNTTEGLRRAARLRGEAAKGVKPAAASLTANEAMR